MASTTLAQYRTRVSAKLRLNATDDATLLTAWANEAYEDILLRTHCKLRPATMALTSGTSSYSLPSQILTVHDVYNASTSDNTQMTRVTLPELIQYRQFDPSMTYPSRLYYSHGDMLELYPAPGDGETLTIWYVPRPTALSADGDVPSDIPAEFHKLIEFWMLIEGSDYQEGTGSSNTDRWLARYEKGLMDLRTAVGRRGATRPARAKVGVPGRLISSDPSRNF